MNKIVVLFVDDWSGLYVNGELKYEDHSIDINQLSGYVPIESIEKREADNEIYNYVEENRGFPETI